MNIVLFAGFIIAAAAIVITVKNNNKEIGMLTAAAVCVITVIAVLPYLRDILQLIERLGSEASIASDKLEPLFKATGIAVISEFSADLCRDNGESAMAKQIEFAGKIMILVIALPIAMNLLDIFATLVKG